MAASSIVLTFLPTSGALKRPAMSKVNDCEQQKKKFEASERCAMAKVRLELHVFFHNFQPSFLCFKFNTGDMLF